MQDGRRGSSAGSSHGSDASSLPLISTPPQRNPSAKGHRPLKQTAIQTPSDCDADSDANSPLEASVGTPSSSEDALSAIQQEKTQLFASSPDLELLCRENGLSAAQFARFSDTVTTLDMFLGFWGSMKSAMYFPALKELSIINQPTICELEGLATCFNLEKLCITECNLTKIGGLSNCTRLKQLNLCSNRIKKLENLESLVNLEQLWVNQNQLERLDGLWRLTKLTQLWACRNRIDRLDTALNNCGSLTEVNLADNRLTNFKGLLSLTNLDQLTVLTLSDPHFGDNPVCRLCNYQTYLMCQLPRLAFLDTVELSARNKQIAEATMIKKKMYYNMRIKSIKRDVHARTRHAETIRNQVEHQVEINVAALVRQKKEIEQFIVESRSLKEALSSQNMLNDLEKKLDCINTCLRERYAAVYRMNQDFERLRCSLRSTSEMNIARLLVELETGGNIRLEDGKPSDAWFVSCVELIRSRLFLSEMRKFGIDDIQINRVTRINNRYLRNRFTARMEEVLEAPDRKVKDNVSKKGITVPNDEADGDRENVKVNEGASNAYQEQGSQSQYPCPGSTLETSMEYLFYVQSDMLDDQQLRGPAAGMEQLFIAENGFRGFAGIGTTDFGAAIRLANSIALLDAPRVAAALLAKGKQSRSNAETLSSGEPNYQQDMKRAMQLAASGDWELPCNVLLVAKVFPGYTKCVSNTDIVVAKVKSGSTGGIAQEFNGVQCVQVTHGGSTTTAADGEAAANKQRLYFVFDSALVLPEYFVEYQYTIGESVLGSSQARSTPSGTIRPTKSPRILHCNEEDTINLGAAAKQVDDFERKYRIRRSQSPQPKENNIYTSTDEDVLHLLQMEPLLPDHFKSNEPREIEMPTISRKLQAASMSRIKYLSLLGCELEAVPDLSALRDHLEVLVLSYNKVQGMCSNLAPLSKLQVLDLSYNHIARMGQLENFSSLQVLEMTHNLIRSFDDVECIRVLGKCGLKRFDLRKNAICDSKRYRLHMLQYLPGVEELDQQVVSQEEVCSAQRLLTRLPLWKVWDLHCQKTRCTIPLSATEVEANTRSSDSHPESDDEAEADSSVCNAEWSSVEEIILNHELLGSIENLDRAVNLRIASFSDNVIKRIDGLQACTRLEELSLDDNEITQIKNLESLTFLKKLHLGRNRLTTIQHLESLENLIQLSLEENQISSLRGLGSAMKLMELYLGNNQIENLKEVQHLKSLPKLTILDLSGNELTRLPDYRLYTVYYLRRVKVLDGVSVSTQDQGNAKQKYSGKLTLEFILDKCGGGGGVGENPFGRLVDMDLSSCRIREISPITGANFPNVREINLENNQISDISSLEGLSSLRVLNLNRNRIDKLAPSNSQSIDYTLPENCDGGGKGILACLNLEQLYLAYNQITDMSVLGLQFLDNLKVLHLQGNAIVYFAGLECNTELVDIRLDKNRIRQLDPHSTLALRQLKFLNLEDNGLKSLSNFNNMLRLETLELSNNRLTELEEVDKLCALPSMLDLRMNNNPLTKRHLYRQHVLFKLTSLRVLDSKDVYSDERERIDLLFLHERAVAGAPGLDRNLDNRAGIGIPHNEVLAGSLLRKTPTTPGMSTPSFPLPEHQVDPSIAIGASNTTTRSLLAPSVNSSRNLTSLGNQSSWQAGSPGAANGSSNFPPSSTVTVASTFNAKSLGSSGTDHLKFVGSSLRRRMLSVHYDQQNATVPAPFQVNSMLNDAKLPVGVVSSPVVVRSPAATIRRAGFNMQPSSIDSQIPLVGASADRTSLNSVNDAANSARGSFSGYVVTFGNQKRHVSLSYPGQQPEPSLPYHSTKMPQQAKRQR